MGKDSNAITLQEDFIMKNDVLYAVNQTHWDREWYRSLEKYRFRMVRMLDKVISMIEEGKMKYFLMDGQTVMLEDFSEVSRDDFTRLINLIKEGSVVIGPWFILPDEFLVGGESMLRNLEIGMKEALKYGTYQKVGYLPDTFGHIGQLPQILKLFGINKAVLWRGINESKALLKWEGPDKSSVNLLALPAGYYFSGLLYEDYIQRIKDVCERLDPYYDNGIYLNLGGDHLEPPSDYAEKIKDVEEQVGVKVVQSTVEQFFDAQDFIDAKTIKGELRDNSRAYLLPGVLSARYYLKQKNQHMEDTLSYYIEPLNTIFSLNGGKYKKDYIERMWKEVLKNQPHDSICGCGIDEIHEEMEMRYRKLYDMEESILDYASAGLFPGLKDETNKYIYIFNPLSSEYSGVVSGDIAVSGMSKGVIGIYDCEENLDADILDIREEGFFIANNTSDPGLFEKKVFKVAFKVKNVPPLGFKKLLIKEGCGGKLFADEGSIENEYYSIKPDPDGSVSIKNKLNGVIIKGINRITHSLDCGDEYNYSPPEADVKSFAKLENYSTLSGSNFSALKMDLVLNVPEGLSENRKMHSKVNRECTITSEITLYSEDRTIHVKTWFENNLKDMRIRVLIPTGEEFDTFYTDTAFDLVERHKVYEESFVYGEYNEAPVAAFPSLSTMVAGFKNPVVISHKAMQETGIERTEYGDAAALTLVRSVGWLSQDDFNARAGGAGPRMKTFGSQCQRPMEFEYGITYIDEDEIYSAINISKRFRQKLMFIQSCADKDIAGLGELKSQNTVLSSIREYEVPGQVLVTLFNPGAYEEEIVFRNEKYIMKPKEIKRLVLKY